MSHNDIIRAWITATAVFLIAVVAIIDRLVWRWKKKEMPKLVFYSHHKTNPMSTIVSSLTLSSLVAQTLRVGIVDENNNDQEIPGQFSNLTFTSGDVNQDNAAPNATVPNGVDIDAVSEQGGTTVTAEGDFVSDKKKADGTPSLQGHFSAVLTVVNNVVVSAKMVFLSVG